MLFTQTFNRKVKNTMESRFVVFFSITSHYLLINEFMVANRRKRVLIIVYRNYESCFNDNSAAAGKMWTAKKEETSLHFHTQNKRKKKHSRSFRWIPCSWLKAKQSGSSVLFVMLRCWFLILVHATYNSGVHRNEGSRERERGIGGVICLLVVL